jgi:transposase
MILLPATRRIFAATEPVDMRRSFDVLHEIAREQLGLDAMRSAVVLFFNRPRTHCKALFHDGTGFVILYKRLDERTFSVPKPTAPADRSVAIALDELALVLDGRRSQKS